MLGRFAGLDGNELLDRNGLLQIVGPTVIHPGMGCNIQAGPTGYRALTQDEMDLTQHKSKIQAELGI